MSGAYRQDLQDIKEQFAAQKNQLVRNSLEGGAASIILALQEEIEESRAGSMKRLKAETEALKVIAPISLSLFHPLVVAIGDAAKGGDSSSRDETLESKS